MCLSPKRFPGDEVSDRILLGTHKGLFRLSRGRRGQWQLAAHWFEGDPVSIVLSRRGTIHVALDLGHFGVKMRRTRDDGANWQETPTPTYPEKPVGEVDKCPMRGTDIPWTTKMIWSLEAGPGGALWCGTLPGGLFYSADNGDSWRLIESLWRDPRRKKWVGGGYDTAGIHSILIDPRDERRVAVGVSVGGVWHSQDAGATWELLGQGLRAEYMPPDEERNPIAQDPHRIVQCAAHPDRMWLQHHNGIFRSDDGGRHWHELNAKPSTFGFTVAAHPSDPDTAWFVPAKKDEYRFPVDAKLVVARTRDGGETFETLDQGLPREKAYDLVYRHGMDVSADGERLVFGSTTGSLWLSEDSGDTWQTISRHLPPIKCARFE